METNNFFDKAESWASGTWSPNAIEEKDFLEKAEQIIGENKNIASVLGEFLVKRKINQFNNQFNNQFKNQFNNQLKIIDKSKEKEISCSDWLPNQLNLRPDMIVGDTVIEVKTLKYNNLDEKRGLQNSNDKIDTIPKKYSGVYKKTGKKVLIIFVADYHSDKVGKGWINGFQGKYYQNNDYFKGMIDLCKKLEINMISYKNFSISNLIPEKKEDNSLVESNDLSSMNSLANALVGVKFDIKPSQEIMV